MAKFIEVTKKDNNKKVLINIEHIEFIEETSRGLATIVASNYGCYKDGYGRTAVETKEKYEDVIKQVIVTSRMGTHIVARGENSIE